MERHMTDVEDSEPECPVCVESRMLGHIAHTHHPMTFGRNIRQRRAR